MAKEPFLVRIAREWGWRAYAIPVLAVITVVVFVDIFTQPQESVGTSSSAGRATTTHSGGGARSGPVPDGEFEGDPDVGQLPPGGDFTTKSSGRFVEVGQAGPKVGKGEKRAIRYAVAIEDTINASRFGGPDAFAAMVNATLADPRGWTKDAAWSFQPVALNDKPDLVVQLSSTNTAHTECGYDIPLETSCHVGTGGGSGPSRVIVNESRWVRGALPFEGDIGAYRQYLINHEVGHALGYAAHEPCANNGGVAPVMMQQTLSTSNAELYALNPNEVYPNDGAVCRTNPWPYPTG